MADYPDSDVLVSTDWVAAHGNDANIRLVEVDVDTTAYETGHIAGAVDWGWQSDLNDPVRRDLIGKQDLERLLGQSGITPDTTVVLYGDNNNWFAAFALWILKIYGHKDTRLMNGGRVKWEDEGRPLTSDIPDVATSRLQRSSCGYRLASLPGRCPGTLGQPQRRYGRRALSTRVHR